MTAKIVFVICAFALLVQSALGQCVGRITAPITPCRTGMGFDGLAYDSLGLDGVWPKFTSCGAIAPTVELAASYGGGLPVTSSSCTAPTGLVLNSDNAYDGPVAIAGNLPFLGTAAAEGKFCTGGAGVISYGCGDGIVTITAEGPFNAAIAPNSIASTVIAPTAASWGYKGIPTSGCGCSASYYN